MPNQAKGFQERRSSKLKSGYSEVCCRKGYSAKASSLVVMTSFSLAKTILDWMAR